MNKINPAIMETVEKFVEGLCEVTFVNIIKGKIEPNRTIETMICFSADKFSEKEVKTITSLISKSIFKIIKIKLDANWYNCLVRIDKNDLNEMRKLLLKAPTSL